MSSTTPTNYTPGFFDAHRDESYRAAKRIVPHLRELLPALHSVLDVGCGIGTWLAAFREAGVEDVVGVDGDYVDRARLVIPADKFISKDLRAPLSLGRKFDLVISMEVAEHLPAERADAFVRSLTEHGEVVLFSAAVPDQGGTDHLNEQWPGYWAEKFRARGYHAIDCLRQRFWEDGEVAWYYAQNMVLYASEQHAAALARATGLHLNRNPLPLVHPKLRENLVWALGEAQSLRRTPHLGLLLKTLPRSLVNSLKHRLGRNGKGR